MPREDLIQLRRGTAAEWTTANPTLDLAEPGLEIDTGRVKYGDGSTPWVGLSYAANANAITVRTDNGGVAMQAETTAPFPNGWPTMRWNNIDADQDTAFGISQGWVDYPGDRNDVWMCLGYNVNASTGGREVDTEPALSLQLESYVPNGADRNMEAHITFVPVTGSIRRPWSFLMERTSLVIIGTSQVDEMAFLPSGSAASRVGFNTVPDTLSGQTMTIKGGSLWKNPHAPPGQRNWDFDFGNAATLACRVVDDGYTKGTAWMTVVRSGTDVSSVTFPDGKVVARAEADREVGQSGNPAFLNNWRNLGGGVDTAGFYKDPSGVVHLKGTLSAGAINATMFVLPVGYRPSANKIFAAISNGAVACCRVHADGSVLFETGSNLYCSLDGISFKAN